MSYVETFAHTIFIQSSSSKTTSCSNKVVLLVSWSEEVGFITDPS